METKPYLKRLNAIYKDIPPSKAKKAKELIRLLAEDLALRDECLKHLAEEGAVTEMPQGNYSIMRENPWSKVADSKTKNILAIMEKLEKLLPDAKTETVTKAGEALAAFVAKGK